MRVIKVIIDTCLHTGYNVAARSAWQVYTVLVEPSRESWYCYPRCMTVDNAAIADDYEQPQSERGNALKLRGKKEKSTAR